MTKLIYLELITSFFTLLVSFAGIVLRHKLTITGHIIISIIAVIGMILTLILMIKIH